MYIIHMLSKAFSFVIIFVLLFTISLETPPTVEFSKLKTESISSFAQKKCEILPSSATVKPQFQAYRSLRWEFITHLFTKIVYQNVIPPKRVFQIEHLKRFDINTFHQLMFYFHKF